MAMRPGGGTPLDTIRIELRTYRIDHEDISALRWVVKSLSLFPALFLSPKRYMKWKQKLASNFLYQKARQTLIPHPHHPHIEFSGDRTPR